jgi:hypothetical protein
MTDPKPLPPEESAGPPQETDEPAAGKEAPHPGMVFCPCETDQAIRRERDRYGLRYSGLMRLLGGVLDSAYKAHPTPEQVDKWREAMEELRWD